MLICFKWSRDWRWMTVEKGGGQLHLTLMQEAPMVEHQSTTQSKRRVCLLFPPSLFIFRNGSIFYWLLFEDSIPYQSIFFKISIHSQFLKMGRELSLSMRPLKKESVSKCRTQKIRCVCYVRICTYVLSALDRRISEKQSLQFNKNFFG